jgi:hypothetical protein
MIKQRFAGFLSGLMMLSASPAHADDWQDLHYGQAFSCVRASVSQAAGMVMLMIM